MYIKIELNGYLKKDHQQQVFSIFNTCLPKTTKMQTTEGLNYHLKPQ